MLGESRPIRPDGGRCERLRAARARMVITAYRPPPACIRLLLLLSVWGGAPSRDRLPAALT